MFKCPANANILCAMLKCGVRNSEWIRRSEAVVSTDCPALHPQNWQFASFSLGRLAPFLEDTEVIDQHQGNKFSPELLSSPPPAHRANDEG